MKTVCYQTESTARRKNNVIDFCAYRERMLRTRAAAVGDELSFHWEIDESVWHSGETSPKPVRSAVAKEAPKSKKTPERMDKLCVLASLAIVGAVWLFMLL
jgi:hypothetical protein